MAQSSRSISLLCLLALLPLVGIVLLRLEGGVSIGHMTRDLAAVAGVHPLTGGLSSLGILLWSGSATVCLFTARRLPAVAHDRRRALLRDAGMLSAYLCIDDLFQVHERLAPNYLLLPEKVVVFGIGLLVAAFLWRHRHELRPRPGAWLAPAALGMLGVSATIDGLPFPARQDDEWLLLVEDGAKWIGICLWCVFCLQRSADALDGRPTSGRCDAEPGLR